MNTPPSKPKILIVDDIPSNIKMLAFILEDDYDVLFATNGRDALETLSQQEVEVILLDIVMPEMSGYEVCEQLKSTPRLKDIPVLFLTAKDSPADEVKGLKLGAADYITKPFTSSVVKARVDTQISLRLLNKQLAEITKDLLEERDFIEHVVLKMSGLNDISDHCLHYWTQPVEKTSGDMLLVAQPSANVRHYVLGDIAGHGLSSAVVGPIISYIFYSMTERGRPIEAIMAEINNHLYRKLPPDVFLTGCFIRLDLQERKLRVWNCAMPDVLIYRRGALFCRLGSKYPPRGFMDGQTELGETFDLMDEDRIFFFSDGIVELFSPDGQMFGLDRLEAFLANLIAHDWPLDLLHAELESFRGGGKQTDDMTIAELVVGRAG